MNLEEPASEEPEFEHPDQKVSGMSAARPLQQKKLVAWWNLSYPVGQPVMRYKLINPLSEGNKTKTRSEAWLMGGHSAMVMVEGVSGGVLVESVQPI